MATQAQLEGAQIIIRRMIQEAASMRTRIAELEAELVQLREKQQPLRPLEAIKQWWKIN